MTQQTRATNKARFETGDAPAETDYADLIDSYLSLGDTAAQTIASPVIISGSLGIGTKVSAALVSANSVVASAMTVLANVSASSVSTDVLKIGGIQVLPSGAGAGIEIYITTTASSTLTSAFTYYPVHASAGVSGLNAIQFDLSADGTVKYTGADSKRFLMQTTIAMKRTNSSDIVGGLRFARNGTSILSSEQIRGISATVGSFSTVAIVTAATNDDFGVQLSIVTPAAASALPNLSVDRMTFVITEA